MSNFCSTFAYSIRPQACGVQSVAPRGLADQAVSRSASASPPALHASLRTFGWHQFGHGYVLAAVVNRNDGWKNGVWTGQFEVDLSGWIGHTVRVACRATNDAVRATTFWIDDLAIETCGP